MRSDSLQSSDSEGGLPRDEVLAEIASLALFELGERRALELLDTVAPADCYFDVVEQWPIWVAREKGSPTPKDLIQGFPYNFMTSLGDSTWIFERTSNHVLFGQVTFGRYRTPVAADLQTHLRHPGEHMSVFQLRSLEPIIKMKAAFPNMHFRIVHMTDTGRRGVLLPKALGWDVLPLPEISFGPNTRMPSSQLPFGRVPLESFALFRSQ